MFPTLFLTKYYNKCIILIVKEGEKWKEYLILL